MIKHPTKLNKKYLKTKIKILIKTKIKNYKVINKKYYIIYI